MEFILFLKVGPDAEVFFVSCGLGGQCFFVRWVQQGILSQLTESRVLSIIAVVAEQVPKKSSRGGVIHLDRKTCVMVTKMFVQCSHGVKLWESSF